MRVDSDHMARALRLAARGLGRTSPNPVVGAVVVTSDGVIVGQGYHDRAGSAHAEIHALDAAGARARGATLYCNLEPCCHIGRTGPCVERIVADGVARVVVSTEDPNPRVCGKGVAFLRAHGLTVEVGPGRDDAIRLNRPFFTFIRLGRPFVIVKIATSLDGRIALAPGVRTRLNSEAAQDHAHSDRAWVDAIAVGARTVLVDDPLLTARRVFRQRPLTRVVLDRSLGTPATSRLFATLDAGPVVIMTTPETLVEQAPRAAALRDAGAELEAVEGGQLDAVFGRLADRGVTAVLVEGGRVLHQAVCEAGLVDRVQAYVAPVVLGSAGVPWVSDRQLSMAGLRDVRIRALGPDILIEGDVYRTH